MLSPKVDFSCEFMQSHETWSNFITITANNLMPRTGIHSLSVSLFQSNYQQMNYHFSLNASLKLAFGQKLSRLYKCFMYHTRKYNALTGCHATFYQEEPFPEIVSNYFTLDLEITSIYFGLNE